MFFKGGLRLALVVIMTDFGISGLWREQGRMFLLSLCMYAALFGLMQLAEWCMPELFGGQLLRWHSAAFCVGVPASVLGTAYVLTVRNPQNYTGFYPGIVMSALLGVQTLLQGQADLCVLYMAVFIPFQALSLLKWRVAFMRRRESGRGGARKGLSEESDGPSFLSRRQLAVTLVAGAGIVAADYVLCTLWLSDETFRGVWWHDVWLKLLGGVMIASSLTANLWMISKKNDAWIAWVVYCIAGVVMFALLRNVFSLLLFIVMLTVNSTALVAWVRQTPKDRMGWLSRK